MSSPPEQPPPVPVFESGLWNRWWFLVLLCVALVLIDWALVPQGVFPVFFIFPVMLVAWNRSLWFAMGCVVLLSLSRVTRLFLFGSQPETIEDMADAAIRICVLALLAMLTSKLGRQTRQLRRHVQVLEGMLPICSFCKRIRDDRGQWVQMEKYISGHSEAQFSHGLCPECAKVHYAGYLEKK